MKEGFREGVSGGFRGLRELSGFRRFRGFRGFKAQKRQGPKSRTLLLNLELERAARAPPKWRDPGTQVS